MCIGLGPMSWPRNLIMNRFVDPAFSCTIASIAALNCNGSCCISTSNSAYPWTENFETFANTSTLAPNCVVFEVSAKYASHRTRGLSPSDRLMETRLSFGNPEGAEKLG